MRLFIALALASAALGAPLPAFSATESTEVTTGSPAAPAPAAVPATNPSAVPEKISKRPVAKDDSSSDTPPASALSDKEKESKDKEDAKAKKK